MARDWNDPLCPVCEFELHVHGHDEWDMEGFTIECPCCGDELDITVEVAEYEYTVTPR